MAEVFKGIWPFVVADLITVGILIAFPRHRAVPAGDDALNTYLRLSAATTRDHAPTRPAHGPYLYKDIFMRPGTFLGRLCVAFSHTI